MREIPTLPSECILLVEVGSTAHGTGIPDGEDLDLMGVVVERVDEVFGLGHGRKTIMQRTQPDGVRSGPGDIDRTLHPLRKFLRLAASGNPSILMCLWAPVLSTTRSGGELRAIAPAFVGRHVIPRYRGYMQSQARRLLGVGGGRHGKRGGGQRPEIIEAHGYDTKYAMHCARLGFQCQELLTTGELAFPIQGWQGAWLRNLRAGLVPFDEWWSTVQTLDLTLAEMLTDESIPPGPSVGRITDYSAQAHLRHWGIIR